jgi:hypothetical protein
LFLTTKPKTKDIEKQQEKRQNIEINGSRELRKFRDFREPQNLTNSRSFNNSQKLADSPNHKNSQKPFEPAVISLPTTSQETSLYFHKTEAEKVNDFNLDDKLSSLFSAQRVVKKTDHLQTLYQQTSKVKKKNKKRTRVFYVGGSISLMGLMILGFFVFFMISSHLLKQNLISFLTQDKNQFSDYAQITTSLTIGKKVVASQLNIYSRLLSPAFFYDSSRVIEVISTLEQASTDLKNLNDHQKMQVLSWLGNPENSFNQDENLTTNQVNPADLYQDFSDLSAQFLELASQDNTLSQKAQTFVKSLNEARVDLAVYQKFLPIIPSVFGQDQSRTYAVIFQNEHELRATGGFIQAVALITFEKGVLIDSQVFSSYQLDDQLAAIVEPPKEIKTLLGEDRFFLRDANWDPDFPNTSSQIAWFLEKTLNKKVDGVIALNIKAFSQILEAVGPLELSEYNELITDKNLAERMEFHSEISLVETQESNDYSVVLLKSLIKKSAAVSPDRVGQLLQKLKTSLQQKQMLVNLFAENESVVMSSLGWNGALLSPSCPEQLNLVPCLVDTLAIVDSNVGVNKANYHIKRQDSHVVILDQNSAKHRHTTTLQNTSQTNAWPKGTYNSYLRVYLPENANDIDVKVNDEIRPLESLSSAVFNDKKIIGLQTQTPIQSQTNIVFEYSVPLLETQVSSKEMSYVFFVQKQPGTGMPLEAVTVSYPPTFTPITIAPQASVDLDSITFTNLGSEHVFVGTTYHKVK